MPEGISISGNVEGDANFVDGDQILGDKVEGDKVGNQVHGDNHGSMEQVNVVGGDYVAKVKEALKKCEESLVDVFGTLDDGLEQGSGVPEGEVPGFGVLPPEEHPTELFQQAYTMLDNPDHVGEQEARTWGDKFKKMCSKAGALGAKALKVTGPIAIALIEEARSSPPPPLNYVKAGLSAVLSQLAE